ncbi:MAG: tyrosine-type recombinase/integrase [Clostridia bacterium]|nr:tyrosine-type recombinase/integrase [Clostridia bacterium]
MPERAGRAVTPDYVSNRFATILRQNDLKHIRFHDLRHSCASLLVAQGVQMKLIGQWLGHSNISTTANIIRSVPQWTPPAPQSAR